MNQKIKVVKPVVPIEDRRAWERTSFWVFLGCVVLTIIMDYFGITADQATEYASGVVKKTFSNINTIIIWIIPVAIQAKEMLSDWQKRSAEKEVKIAEIEKTGRPAKPRAKKATE